MKKPNLFIVGAARSGTTSLWQMLRKHPKIYMPEDELYKEPGFFSDLRGMTDMEEYLRLFSESLSDHKFVGEASTAYLSDPASAQNIYNYNPDAKIIIILRNPAYRAYSLYNWMVQDGYEFAGTFNEALQLEQKRTNKQIPNWFEPEYYWNYMYFQSGLYSDQVKRYLDLFGDHVLIIRFEDFKRDALQLYYTVCSFLGIEKHVINLQIHNPSRSALSAKIQFILRKLNNDFYERCKELSMSGRTWHPTVLFDENAKRLSQHTRFSIKDRIVAAYIRRKLDLFYKQKEIKTKTDTKECRDQLLNLGLCLINISALSPRTKRILLRKYTTDIYILSDLTKLDFTYWLSQ